MLMPIPMSMPLQVPVTLPHVPICPIPRAPLQLRLPIPAPLPCPASRPSMFPSHAVPMLMPMPLQLPMPMPESPPSPHAHVNAPDEAPDDACTPSMPLAIPKPAATAWLFPDAAAQRSAPRRCSTAAHQQRSTPRPARGHRSRMGFTRRHAISVCQCYTPVCTAAGAAWDLQDATRQAYANATPLYVRPAAHQQHRPIDVAPGGLPQRRGARRAAPSLWRPAGCPSVAAPGGLPHRRGRHRRAWRPAGCPKDTGQTNPVSSIRAEGTANLLGMDITFVPRWSRGNLHTHKSGRPFMAID